MGHTTKKSIGDMQPAATCMATSTDELLTWQKSPTTVINGPPEEIADQTGGHFRDRFIWRDGTRWLMMIGSKLKDKVCTGEWDSRANE